MLMCCDRCGLDFFDYQGYEEVEDEGIVCMECIIEAEEAAADEEDLDQSD